MQSEKPSKTKQNKQNYVVYYKKKSSYDDSEIKSPQDEQKQNKKIEQNQNTKQQKQTPKNYIRIDNPARYDKKQILDVFYKQKHPTPEVIVECQINFKDCFCTSALDPVNKTEFELNPDEYFYVYPKQEYNVKERKTSDYYKDREDRNNYRNDNYNKDRGYNRNDDFKRRDFNTNRYNRQEEEEEEVPEWMNTNEDDEQNNMKLDDFQLFTMQNDFRKEKKDKKKDPTKEFKKTKLEELEQMMNTEGEAINGDLLDDLIEQKYKQEQVQIEEQSASLNDELEEMLEPLESTPIEEPIPDMEDSQEEDDDILNSPLKKLQDQEDDDDSQQLNKSFSSASDKNVPVWGESKIQKLMNNEEDDIINLGQNMTVLSNIINPNNQKANHGEIGKKVENKPINTIQNDDEIDFNTLLMKSNNNKSRQSSQNLQSQQTMFGMTQQTKATNQLWDQNDQILSKQPTPQQQQQIYQQTMFQQQKTVGNQGFNQQQIPQPQDINMYELEQRASMLYPQNKEYNQIKLFIHFTKNLTTLNINDYVWHYKDPQNIIQGPFSSVDMDVWNLDQYFPANLQIAWKQTAEFVTISTFKQNPMSLISRARLNCSNFSKFIKTTNAISSQMQQFGLQNMQFAQQQAQGGFKDIAPNQKIDNPINKLLMTIPNIENKEQEINVNNKFLDQSSVQNMNKMQQGPQMMLQNMQYNFSNKQNFQNNQTNATNFNQIQNMQDLFPQKTQQNNIPNMQFIQNYYNMNNTQNVQNINNIQNVQNTQQTIQSPTQNAWNLPIQAQGFSNQQSNQMPQLQNIMNVQNIQNLSTINLQNAQKTTKNSFNGIDFDQDFNELTEKQSSNKQNEPKQVSTNDLKMMLGLNFQ